MSKMTDTLGIYKH